MITQLEGEIRYRFQKPSKNKAAKETIERARQCERDLNKIFSTIQMYKDVDPSLAEIFGLIAQYTTIISVYSHDILSRKDVLTFDQLFFVHMAEITAKSREETINTFTAQFFSRATHALYALCALEEV